MMSLLRIVFVTLIALVPALAGAEPLTERQSWIFAHTCAHCHAVPGIGVPMLGDEDAWAPRRAKGLDALVRDVVLGVGNMPPLGTCGFCTEEDLRGVIAFMVGIEAGAGSGTEDASAP